MGQGYNEDEAGQNSAVLIGAGLVGALVSGLVLDRTCVTNRISAYISFVVAFLSVDTCRRVQTHIAPRRVTHRYWFLAILKTCFVSATCSCCLSSWLHALFTTTHLRVDTCAHARRGKSGSPSNLLLLVALMATCGHPNLTCGCPSCCTWPPYGHLWPLQFATCGRPDCLQGRSGLSSTLEFAPV